MAEPTQTDYANLLALGNSPTTHGRVGCNACAEERCDPGQIELRWDSQDKALVDDDAIGVATVGYASEMFVRRVEGERQARAEVLKPGLTPGTDAVGIDQAADCGEIANLILGNRCAHLRDTPDDFMARNNRVNSRIEFAPLIPDRMEVRVADAAKKDVNLHIVMGWIAPRNCRAGKRRCCAGSGVSFGLIHGWILLGIVCRRLVPSSPPTFRQAAPLWRYESWQWLA